MKTAIISIIFFCLAHIANAQVSQGSVDSAKGYALSRVSYEYLSRLTEPKKVENYKKIRSELLQNNPISPISVKHLTDLLNANSFGKTSVVVNNINSIQTDLSGNVDGVADSIVSSIKQSSIFSTLPIANSNEFRDSIKIILGRGVIIAKVDGKVNDERKPEEESTKTTENGIWSFNFNVWNHLLPLIVTLLFFIICLIKFSNVNDRIDTRKEEIKQMGSKPLFTGGDKDYSKIDKKIDDLRNAMSILQSDIEYLKRTRQDGINTVQKNENFVPNTNQNFVTKKPEQAVFYMGSPIENFFPINSRSNEYRKGLVLYKFYPNQNQNEAHFEFVSDEETIKHIRSNSMELVNPACVSQNSPSVNTNSVRTIKKGFARFDNDKWNIIDKAEIKFE
jgi:hypothetical protein